MVSFKHYLLNYPCTFKLQNHFLIVMLNIMHKCIYFVFLPAGHSASKSCDDLHPGSVVCVSSVSSVLTEFSTPEVEFLARHEVIDNLDEEGMAGVGPLSFGIASLVNKLLKKYKI